MNGNDANEGEASNKRPALSGQWQTPPMPAFPAGGTATAPAVSDSTTTPIVPDAAVSNASVVVPQAALPAVSQLPGSAEDYAKALEEAYRRGAEAAAAMAAGQAPLAGQQQQQQQAPAPLKNSAVSCPDLQASMMTTHSVAQQPPVAAAIKNEPETSEVPILPPAIPNPLVTGSSTAPSATMPPPLPVQQQQKPPPPGQHQQRQQQPMSQRSMSLPDMTSYAAQQEEEKRKKRLARNRASARLRRLRKKNLVDAYETEVGILEKTLQQLQAHQWGAQDNATALAEALSMDRGQQVLDLAERQQAANDILQQQLNYVQRLEELMQEQYILQQLKDSPDLADLVNALQLTDDQLQQLQDSSSGWEEEWAALQTVKASLQAMKDNDWLWNTGCAAIVDQFMSILQNKNQVSKFLLWADHNVEAIDELDGVHAAPGVPTGPVFHFGVDSHPEGLAEE